MPDAYSLWEKGQDLLSQARYKDAIAVLQQALSIWPVDLKSIEHDVLWDLGRAYDELGEMDEAKKAYDKAGIIYYPIEDHWKKAKELKQSGKFSEALRELQKLKVLDPEDESIADEIKKTTKKIEKG